MRSPGGQLRRLQINEKDATDHHDKVTEEEEAEWVVDVDDDDKRQKGSLFAEK